MRKKLKIISKIGFRLILLVGVFALGFYAYSKSQTMLCDEMKIDIDYQGIEPIIDREEIVNDILLRYDSLQGVRMGDLPLESLETYLKQIPEVENAEVYTSIGGKLGINVKQRIPIGKIFTDNGNSYYIDKTGFIYQPKFEGNSRIPIINGNIPQNLETNSKLANDIALIINAINKQKFLQDLIEEIYINDKKEFELIPKIGKQIILLGDISQLNEKLKNLELFYAQGMKPADGWNKYKKINLKFNKQVVCTK